MLKEQARLVAAVVYLADLALVALAFVAAHFVRGRLAPAFGVGEPGLPPLAAYLPLLPVALAIWSALLWSSGRYRSHRQVPLAEEAKAIARVCLLGAGALALAVWGLRLDERLLGAERFSRAWMAVFAVLVTLFLLAEKVALRLAARTLRERGLNYRNILIVGTGPTALRVAESIAAHRWWGYRVRGFLAADENGAAGDPRARPLLGTLADLDAVRAGEVVDEVIFALPVRATVELEDRILALQEQGVLVRFALELFPHPHARVQLQEVDGLPLVSLATSPVRPLELAVKRSIDVVFSLALLALLWPLLAAVALALRAGGGPVLFRQTRSGLNGRQFTLYKFRTMVEGAHERMGEVAHLNEMNGPVFKVTNDPRVTPFGRFLRKFSLDELPQLWNVLRGDMSLVGPRPPLPAEVERYERWQLRRLSMKPGLTGLWQVSGRNRLDFEHWMALDLEYIDSWSPWLDLKILARTVPVVLSGRGAS
jgi:exopolysaccharide biosynthesis polyprenyl glycosylphosphotransferase